MTDPKSSATGLGGLLLAASVLATLAGWGYLSLHDEEVAAESAPAVQARLAPGDPIAADIPEVVSIDTTLPPPARRPDVVSSASGRRR